MNAVSVAEHAASLILALAKALPYLDREVRQTNWKSRYDNRPVELDHKILGVVGFGKIGSAIAAIMHRGFGMEILAYDPYVQAGHSDLKLTFCELAELLSRADFVTLHLPATPETKGLLNKERLALLKPSAYFINTARGSVVDEQALLELLQTGKIAGAGLDVFEQEPLPLEHPLMKLDNVILSPHTAALSQECVIKVAVEAAQAVVDALAGREPRYVYNKSELT
jgi:D-3-phosphoglycerate dehydrogenase